MDGHCIAKREGVAIFGMGRAGNIHFRNLIANKRAVLLYVVDLDAERASAVVKENHATECKVLSPDQQDMAFQDSRCMSDIAVTAKTYSI